MTPIFKNVSVGNEVKIDLDVFWECWFLQDEDLPDDLRVGINIFKMRAWLEKLQKERGVNVESVEYRKSSNGHVHMRLIMRKDIAALDAFMLRAWFLDDKTRMALDLKRYLLTGDIEKMNRLFDEKATSSGIRKAGPWTSLDKIPSDLPPKDVLRMIISERQRTGKKEES
jgi:hypothetical protein